MLLNLPAVTLSTTWQVWVNEYWSLATLVPCVLKIKK